MAGDVAALPSASLHVWYEHGADREPSVDDLFAGMMDLSRLNLPGDAIYYLCGPVPFMQSIRSTLIERGVRARDIQYEVFGPDLWRADAEYARRSGQAAGGHDR